MPSPLPIDTILDELVASFRAHPRLVVEAPAGAGKTTRVPASLWRAGLVGGEIWVAEPRRLAAKIMAHRVAGELDCRLGELVGYTVRFDDCSSPNTRIRYVTSGILLRRLLTDRNLSGVDCVILDEFHERHLDTDLALALLAQLQSQRKELRLVLMSATLDGARLAGALGDCPRIRSEGRLYPLEVEFDPTSDDRPLEKRVSSALRRVLVHDPHASSLVFLPGAAEIRRVQSTITPLCEEANVDIAILHGDMPLDAQAKAIAPGKRPRVVLTTNIAESSITVEGVTAVIDSGLARQKSYSAFSGISQLAVQKISRASAAQRAGRAGRTAPGRVLRLYTRGDFESRPEFELPEILRADFSESLLLLLGATKNNGGVTPQTNIASLENGTVGSAMSPVERSQDLLDGLLLIDRPNLAAVESAVLLLHQLGCIDRELRVTATGTRMLSLPLHPRLSRLLLECGDRDIADIGALAVALLSERDIRSVQRDINSRHERLRKVVSGDSDLLEVIELYLDCQMSRDSAAALRSRGVDPSAYYSVRQAHQHLQRLMRCTNARVDLDETAEQSLAQALLMAFPDRVAKRRNPAGAELVLRSGTTAKLAESSVVATATWLVAVDVEERRELSHGVTNLVRIASAIRTDWLLDVLADQLTTDDELCWLESPGRVEMRSRIRLGSLTVEESRRPAVPSPAVASVLGDVIARSGLLQSDELTRLTARMNLVSAAFGNPASNDTSDLLKGPLQDLLMTRNDLSGIDGSSLAQQIIATLPHEVVDRLRNETPDFVNLPKGRRCQIHYEPGRSPWIASRLQDFFGLRQTPTILSGRQKLVVHLLAPNQRAVQITDDLEGFWVRHYAEIRRELMRRYPRHPWPENGLTASPPEPRSGRRQT